MEKTVPVDDAVLVRACRNGDMAAFETLAREHRPRIVAQAMRVLNDYDAAESAAQDVLLRVYKSMRSFREEARFTTWLYTVTRNVCLTRLARERQQRAKLDAWHNQVAQDSSANGLSMSREFASIISAVGPDERQMLAMRFVYDWEISDIAAVMNLSVSATKMRLYRSLEKIRRQLDLDTIPIAA